MGIGKKFSNKYAYFVLIAVALLLLALYIYKTCFTENFTKRYKLAVISVFKKETMNLRVWLDHYISQGVSHFYLTDNGSTDNPLNILQPYIDSGLVSYVYNEKKHNQEGNIRSMVDNYDIKRNVKWLINCDLDEFFFGLKAPLVDVIDDYEQYDVIYTNWCMFGSNGLDKHPPDIRTAITARKEALHDDSVNKYIFQPAKLHNTDNITVHSLSGDYRSIRENESIRLYHYPIQSREFFEKVKMTRGDVYTSNNESVRDWTYFDMFNGYVDTEDSTLRNIVLYGYE